MIKPVSASPDNLRFLFGHNRAYSAEAALAAITTCVERLRKRQAYQPPAHNRRWKLSEFVRGFHLTLFPFTLAVIEQLEANDAIQEVKITAEEEGRANIILLPSFSHNEIQPQIEEVLKIFAGENPKEKPTTEKSEE